MIYTSYFGALSKLRKEPDLCPISIARYSPKWFTGPQYLKLAPTSDMLKMDFSTYTTRFFSILSKLDPLEIEADLHEIAAGKTPVLLCYEAYSHECATAQKTLTRASHIAVEATRFPKLFCHRHFVARWLNSSGIECDEFNAMTKIG